MTYNEQAIQFVVQAYLRPARETGKKEVRVRAGDVHKGLGWSNRVPSVCQALTSKKFLDANQLTLKSADGPPSGMGMNMVYTFGIQALKESGRKARLEDLWGIGRGWFQDQGGGEAWLNKERESFYDSGKDPLSREDGKG